MLSPIDDQGDCVASCHFSGINLGFPEEHVPVRATKEACCLSRVWVLVNADKLLVFQDINRALRSDRKIATDDQRCFGKSPESEVSLFLFMSQSPIANLKHIWVSPSSWSSSLKVLLRLLEVILDRGKVIKDILSCSPAICDRWGPSPGFLFSPIAH